MQYIIIYNYLIYVRFVFLLNPYYNIEVEAFIYIYYINLVKLL
jgi:hypothetical protein